MQHSDSRNKQAIDELMPLVYNELRRLAAHYLLNERPATRFARPPSFTRSISSWPEAKRIGMTNGSSSLLPLGPCATS